MKNLNLKTISLFLALIMLLGVFASCTDGTGNQTTGTETSATEKETSDETRANTEGESENTSESEKGSESDPESDTEGTETETEVPTVYPELEGTNGKVITNANQLWGGVNVYYQNGTRKDLTIENNDMAINIHAAPDGNALVGSINNTKGNSYIENTMDVFVKMENGTTLYASKSLNPITFDMYRFGMYYYELRAQNQNFISQYNVTKEWNLDVEHNNPRSYYEMSRPKYNEETGAVSTTMLDKADPRIYYSHAPFSADAYNCIAVDVRVTSADPSYMRSLSVFVFNNDGGNYCVTQSVANDGDFHTYYFMLDSWSKYAGSTIKEFRFDFSGIIGDVLEYKNVRAVKADTGDTPDIRLCRYIHMFSDKAQQVIQISARKTTEGIKEIGVVTNISTDRVNAIVVKDKNGTHNTIEGVDWDSVEYVGFDVADAGVFGYILLPDGDVSLFGTTVANDTSSGKIKITEEDGKYVIVQSRAPANGRLIPPTDTDNTAVDNYVENFDNCADFYMGHRIYTDESHDFAAFIKEAELERNPLPKESITVHATESTEASYLGYDPLRGMYVFKVAGSNFNRPFYEEPNKHFNVKFTVKGDDRDRNMYIMTTTTHGELQCAAVLDPNGMLLPINVEVGKNFSDSGQNYFDAKDEPWSEAYFPMYVKAGEENTLNFLNLYMNWGRFPLKQISFIQLAPLYHLSTGVTETNCILPWYSSMGGTRNIWTIPDHRPMSAPFWATQPNHTSGGDHRFLRYTDSEGNFNATEQKSNYITSYGPTYAEVIMNYLSDDGKIKVSYTHMEMPQTDENRAYYTMEYEILEDVSFNSFKDDFFFYSMNAYSGVDYDRVSYLDENNEIVQRPPEAKAGRTRYFVLGDNCPYFAFYRDDQCKLERGYVNLSFLIYNAEFKLQNADKDPNFVVLNKDKHLYLSLNLEEFTLKAGDRIKINAIIMPWGSQESDYTLEDKNVQDVRQNTLLNPLTVVPEAGCTVMESNFLPKVRVSDGRSATFTVKGASGNSTVHVYGLSALSRPVIYEKVDGEWVRYNLSSQYYPDKKGYGQAYDGYAVQYHTDGTFSYSFVVDMSDGKDRTFKFMVTENFKEEEKPDGDIGVGDIYGEAGIVEGPNLMLSASDLYNNSSKTSASKAMASESGVKKDADGTEYFRFYATKGQSEAWIMPYTVPVTPNKTGKYLIIKYRLPSTNTVTTRFEIWTSTDSSVPQSGQCFSYYKDYLSADDQWRILVIDLSQMSGINYDAAPNGDYYANFLRFDMFDSGYSEGSYIDIQYISFDDRAVDIFAYPENKGFDKVTFYDGRVLDVPTSATEFPEPKVVYEDDTAEYDNAFDVYLSAKKLAHLGSSTSEFGLVTYVTDGDYVRFNSHAFSSESDFTIYRPNETKESGRYIVIKYRASATQNSYMQIYATTLDLYNVTTNPEGKRYFDESNAANVSNANFIRDGEWQIVILDLSTITKEYTAKDGKFCASWIRLDVFNGKQGTTDEYVDIAYIGLIDDLKKAVTFDKSVESALVRVNSSTATRYSTATGDIFEGGSTTNPDTDPEDSQPGSESETEPETEPVQVPESPEPLLFLTPEQIVTKVQSSTNLGGTKLSEDGSYVTVTNKKGTDNGFFFVADNNASIGQYIIIKYRTAKADRWEWYVKTKGQNYGYFFVDPMADGEWQTVIIDLSKSPDGTYAADEGKYYAAAIRWGIMRNASDEELSVDIAFIAVGDNIKALASIEGVEEYTYYGYFDLNKVALSEKPVYFHLNSFGSNAGLKAQRFSSKLIFDKSHQHYPTSQGFINTSPSTLGKIYIAGWAGICGNADNFVFRVLDSEGNVLQDWSELDPEKTYHTFNESVEEGVIKAVNANMVNANAYNFRGYANLNAFVGQRVNLEFAFALMNDPSGERFFTIMTAEDVKVTN